MFALLNAGPQPKPGYWRNSQIPLFKLLKVQNVEPAVTVNGPTTKVLIEFGSFKQFFYLNADDHQKFVSNPPLYQEINSAAAEGQNVFCFSVKRRSALGIGWIPHSKFFPFICVKLNFINS